MKWILIPVLAFIVAFIPGMAWAAEDETGGVLIRIDGDAVVPSGETIDSVVVVNGNATVAGTVTGSVFVVEGTLTVLGRVDGDVTVVSGTIDLRDGSSVDNVHSISSDFLRAPNATVTGEVNSSRNFTFLSGVAAALSFLFWAGMTVAVVGAGLFFAAFGGRQLNESARTATGNLLGSFVGFVFVWIGVPILAGIAMATLIGIPFGIGLLFFLMPALWFLGYIVAGSAIGRFIVGDRAKNGNQHPYLATFVGLLLLQLGILIPGIGLLVAMVVGAWGAGALAYFAYRSAGGTNLTPSGDTAVGQGQAQPAA